uniref:Type 4 fimbrial biogenesis protein PilX N-terminal domain-containing protein n=1 Tax=Eiseniibacteriota bacterium TaxID=2212470 RepID=A0A832I1M0_UNCEI
MRRPWRTVRDERGVALVMALMVLLTMSLLAVILLMNVNVNRRIAGHNVRADQALNIAEAGVSEALARIRSGDISLNPGNPRAVAQIFLTTAGSVPVPANADTVAMETSQPAGAWLRYSTPNKGPDVLTVAFRTDAARTVVHRYDPSLANPINTASGWPIYRITSTGRQGPNRRRIVTEAIQKPFNAIVNAAMAADVGIDFKGNGHLCGYNHPLSTPSGTRDWPNCSPYHVAGGLPGSWSTTNTTSTGSAAQYGSPVARSDNNVGFYAGPWEVFGMSQAEFFAWVGNPVATGPQPPRGIIHIDNNGVSQDLSASEHYNGGDGEGFLYVDGDLQINGNFTFKGLVYVEGDLDINGTAWILGAVIVKGVSRLNIANGNFSLLYSREAIEQMLAKYGGQFVTLSWREVTP